MEQTNFVLFHPPNKPLVRNVWEMATESMVINRFDAVKYLGITIDEKLTWSAHIENVCNSLIKIFISLNNCVTKWPQTQFDNFIMHLYTIK